MTISNQEVYDSLRNDMVGGNQFVIHRENIARKTQIHKFKLQDNEVVSYELPHTVENIICLDFNSFYGSCMSSEQHPLIPYTNHRMYMPGRVNLCLAIAHVSWPIKDKKLLDELYSQLFPSASNENYYDKKKILGWNIESESTTCLALAPKCYYMENNMNQKITMKLKGVKHRAFFPWEKFGNMWVEQKVDPEHSTKMDTYTDREEAVMQQIRKMNKHFADVMSISLLRQEYKLMQETYKDSMDEISELLKRFVIESSRILETHKLDVEKEREKNYSFKEKIRITNAKLAELEAV
ncbi:MAG: hypothetical protein EZS28_019750 [Streblomastix strix]|uniref:Uncharacterized protein n=1 Tax=Streblomastix strix TaxID=222440 RepID=A0A5J4VQF2_9EUKA|nr:MAG: hypothetical protein EZS28_019750 [Streblomastix strix]